MFGSLRRTVLARAGVLLLLVGAEARGHIPDKIVIDLELRETSWVASSEMDVRFAVTTLMRHYLPPDSGVAWVDNLSPGQLGLVKEVTEELYRERFQLSVDGRALEMEVDFPDFERSPLRFHAAANGEMMTRVVMGGPLPAPEGVVVRWEGRWGPTLVLSVKRPGTTEGPRIHTLALGESVTLGAAPGAEAAEDSTMGWTGWLRSGFVQLLRSGPVHVLFIVGLVLLVPRWQALLLQVGCFTLGHSLTLWLVGLRVVEIRSGLIEPLLALSVVYIGIENLFLRSPTAWRLGMVSGFGLLHGVGLALVLLEIGSAGASMLSPLSGFHLGVELGQLSVMGLALLVTLPFLRRNSFGRVRILGSTAIAAVGLFWAVDLMVM